MRDRITSIEQSATTINSPTIKTHRALAGNRNLGMRLSTVGTPVCGPYDVIIAPRFVGLCGTDIQVFRGALNVLANTLGHEGVGVVAEVGGLLDEWSPGDPVVFRAVNPHNPDEVLGYSFDGLFQENILIQDVRSMNWLIQSIPDDMLSPVGALIEPVATAIYAQELVGRPPGEGVAVVVGDGPMALINSIVLRISGFSTVLLVHSRSQRYRWAVDNDFFDCGDAIFGRDDVAARILERLGGALVDVAIVCTPGEAVEQVLKDALIYLKPGGIVDLVSTSAPSVVSLEGRDLDVTAIRSRNWCGSPSPGYFEQIETVDGKNIRMTSQRGASASHMSASIELLGERSGDFDALVTDVVDLADAPKLISSVVAWSVGRRGGGEVDGGDRPMKAVIELNKGKFNPKPVPSPSL
jgi:threonine dehydrogenase-like Zn-dependent dehydrogenase